MLFLSLLRTHVRLVTILILFFSHPPLQSDAQMLVVHDSIKDGVDGVEGIDSPVGIACSPDGKYVYVVGSNDHSLAVFSRDGATGTLNQVTYYQQGIGGVYGLQDPDRVIISPDGIHLYVTSRTQDSIAVFNRNSTSGLISYVAHYFNGIGGVNGMDAPDSIIISPDGRHLYICGFLSDSLAVFSRNEVTGMLTFLTYYVDGVGGINDIRYPDEVTISPSGDHVYVAAQGDSAISVFSRDSSTGYLTLVQVVRNGDGNITSLSGVSNIACSPDGKNIYTGAPILSYGGVMTVFSRNINNGTLTLVEQVAAYGGAIQIIVSSDGSHVYIDSYPYIGYDPVLDLFSRSEINGALTKVEPYGACPFCFGDQIEISFALSPDGANLYIGTLTLGSPETSLINYGVYFSHPELQKSTIDAVTAERQRWDINDDNQVGLEEAINAIQVVSGM